MTLSKVTFCFAVLFLLHLANVVANPGMRQDVMQGVRLDNRLQCKSLCWYRKLCSSFSFHSSLAPPHPNCYLHTDSVPSLSATTMDAVWAEETASESNIANGCNTRPCSNTEICTRTYSSYACRFMPSQCGTTAVPHGAIIVNGTIQNDVARVQCDAGYVASPKDVSMDIVCLVTSRWSLPAGSCHQYEIGPGVERNEDFSMPWNISESTFCVKGTFVPAFAINFVYSTNPKSFFHLKFDYDGTVMWNLCINGGWQNPHSVAPNLLVSGESFNLTVGIVVDALHLVVNTSTEAENFNIQLADITDASGSHADLRTTRAVYVSGETTADYLNLIEGC